jgi:predicted outer membrane repeat protein
MRLIRAPRPLRRFALPAITGVALTACVLAVLSGCSEKNPTAPSTGATIVVDVAGGGDYSTIQGGIAAANGGDTVLVMPGTYTGAANRDIDFGGRNIVLRAASTRDTVVIDCDGAGRAFHLHSGEGRASTIEGFVVVGGNASRGGGAYLEGASPTIRNVVFRNNVAENDGGGMYCGRDPSMRGASPALTNVVFDGNVAVNFSGGGLFCDLGSSPALTDVSFTENEASSGGGMACIFADPTLAQVGFVRNAASFVGGGLYCAASSPVLEDVSFLANSARNGGAVALSGSAPSITHATIVNNEAIDAGGIFCDNASAPTIRKTLIAFNIGPGAVFCAGDDAPDTQRSCLYWNDGGDVPCGTYSSVLFVDPLFCDVNEDDLTLCSNSPCLPGGNPWGVRIGAHGEGCSDCGSSLGDAPWRRKPFPPNR